jgi:transcriptional regulator with XRE-family HTH domain
LAERVSTDGEYVRQSEISRIENGRITLPRRERLERLAAVLDLPLGELLARSGWVGAEQHFQPSSIDRPAEESMPRFHNGAQPQIAQPATPTSSSSDAQQPSVPFGASVRDYDPGAIAGLRRALQTMREQSARLHQNRLESMQVQRRFHETVEHTSHGQVSQAYSDTARD